MLMLPLEICDLSKTIFLTGKSNSGNISTSPMPDGLTVTASPSGSADFDQVKGSFSSWERFQFSSPLGFIVSFS